MSLDGSRIASCSEVEPWDKEDGRGSFLFDHFLGLCVFFEVLRVGM